MYRMENVIQHYQWGSRDFIPALVGITPDTEQRYAELWMGAHPNGSSVIEIDNTQYPLVDLVQTQPNQWLGAHTHEQYGTHFPFLLKVLAINTALSIQVHPADWQAAEGYAAEERSGVARGAPTRLYKDNRHKPELICALTPIWALCGFREAAELEAEFRLPHYQPLHNMIAGALTIEQLFPLLLTLNDEDERHKTALLQACAAYINRLYPDLHATAQSDAVPPSHVSQDVWKYWWVLRLMKQFPDDLGALAPLYLNLFCIEPTKGLYIGARTPHAYLFGNGIEIMANSDNVLRCALSKKHIDSRELLRVVNLAYSDYRHISPVVQHDTISEYHTLAKEFRLVALKLNASRPRAMEHDPLPKILLCTDGAVTVSHTDENNERARSSGSSIRLTRGQSLFCLPHENRMRFEGDGTIYMGIPATELRYRVAAG